MAGGDIRVKAPPLKIFIGHMGSSAAEQEGWSKIEADVVSFSLQDLLQQLNSWKPVLESSNKAVADTPSELRGPHTTEHQLVPPARPASDTNFERGHDAHKRWTRSG